MPVDQIDALRRKIRNGLKDLVSQEIPAEEAVTLYKECLQHYRTILNRSEVRRNRSHLRGLLYLHNIHNMAKGSAIFIKGEVPRLYCYSGERHLGDRLQEFMEGADNAVGTGSVRRVDDDTTVGVKHLYLHSFRSDPQEIIIISASNSVYFEDAKFVSLCVIVEALFAYAHEASLPRHADAVHTLKAALQSVITSGAGSAQVLLYSINRVTQMLAHTTSFDLARIHEMVHQYLIESYPEASAVIPVSIFRYIVIAGQVVKPVSSMSFGGTIIPLTVRRHSVEDASSVYKILWEA
jgi:hypothetical protein